jgi:hypothetical protein
MFLILENKCSIVKIAYLDIIRILYKNCKGIKHDLFKKNFEYCDE